MFNIGFSSRSIHTNLFMRNLKETIEHYNAHHMQLYYAKAISEDVANIFQADLTRFESRTPRYSSDHYAIADIVFADKTLYFYFIVSKKLDVTVCIFDDSEKRDILDESSILDAYNYHPREAGDFRNNDVAEGLAEIVAPFVENAMHDGYWVYPES